ncbi:AraC family transcriptional regulator [Caulobacter sp. FWC2]|uniref:AraC family transcriptional regulator n=1 Tax=Caulobacter sp. FWC2 TaxID=69664 RepID=UPI0013041B9A|nr:AraC family transcriptional regulator [Caulobacter sp. FWC2]
MMLDWGTGASARPFCSVRLSSGGLAGHDAWHHHPEYELGWIVRGQGTRFVGDSVEPYRARDLVLLGPNFPHFYHDDTSPLAPWARPELTTLQFRPEVVDTHFLGLPEARDIAALLRIASQRGLQVQGETAARVQETISGLSAKVGMARLIGLLEILETLAQGGDDLRPLASSGYSTGKGSATTTRRRIEQIDRHVRENLGQEIKQVDVAGLVGLTPHAFSRFFRKATGLTFVGFVNRLRINEACHRLLETDDGITEIAFGCGYWSIANFNRQFLNLKGVNPSRFREKRLRTIEATTLTQIAEPYLEIA